MRTMKVLGIIFVIVVSGRLLWINYAWIVEDQIYSARNSSDVARWWRCRDVTRPLLKTINSSWNMRYAWSGGMGPGEVSIEVSSDGTVVVRSRSNEQTEWATHHATLSKNDIHEIANAIDESGLLCQSTQQRDGYHVYDLGQYTLTIETGNTERTLTIDGCRTIPDEPAFNEVVQKLVQHKDKLGEEINWGPYGTTSAAGSCAADAHPPSS